MATSGTSPPQLQLHGADRLGPVRIVLVEDDAGDAFLVRELLEETGADLSITWVRSVAEAARALPDGCDCVLLDLGLPDAHGIDAVTALVDIAGSAAVLVLTGLSDEQRGVQAVAAGAQDYLRKGAVDGPLLLRAVRYAVERKRTDMQLRRLYEIEVRAAENLRLERGLLPQPQIHDPSIEVVTRYRPGRDSALGGDFYDVVETDDGTVYVLVGDVAGHGPDEAALGVCLRIAWRTLVLSGTDRERLLPVLDEVLVRERRSEEVFATVCMVVIPSDRASARILLAGHPAPIMLETDRPHQLTDELVGPAIGVLSGVVWGSWTVALPDTWRMMLFTDGLVEGYAGAAGDRLGVEGLVRLIDSHPADTEPGALVDSLIAAARDMHGDELADDVAVLVIGRSGGQR